MYRKQDDPALMHLNDRTFDAAIEALQKGGAVQIYPEGQSHSEPSLTPLRTGAARIALLAEARADWTVGLQVHPVGLTYAKKHLFRGRVIAAFGEPIPVGPLRARYEVSERDAVRALTEEIREGLEALTLNYETARDRELFVEALKRLGFEEADFTDGGSDRVVDAIVAWGTPDDIRARIEAHWDAGADHVCIQPFSADGSFRPDEGLLEILAPGA